MFDFRSPEHCGLLISLIGFLIGICGSLLCTVLDIDTGVTVSAVLGASMVFGGIGYSWLKSGDSRGWLPIAGAVSVPGFALLSSVGSMNGLGIALACLPLVVCIVLTYIGIAQVLRGGLTDLLRSLGSLVVALIMFVLFLFLTTAL